MEGVEGRLSVGSVVVVVVDSSGSVDPCEGSVWAGAGAHWHDSVMSSVGNRAKSYVADSHWLGSVVSSAGNRAKSSYIAGAHWLGSAMSSVGNRVKS